MVARAPVSATGAESFLSPSTRHETPVTPLTLMGCVFARPSWRTNPNTRRGPLRSAVLKRRRTTAEARYVLVAPIAADVTRFIELTTDAAVDPRASKVAMSCEDPIARRPAAHGLSSAAALDVSAALRLGERQGRHAIRSEAHDNDRS